MGQLLRLHSLHKLQRESQQEEMVGVDDVRLESGGTTRVQVALSSWGGLAEGHISEALCLTCPCALIHRRADSLV